MNIAVLTKQERPPTLKSSSAIIDFNSNMNLALITLSALNPVDRASWQAQNLIRRVQERTELQVNRLFEQLLELLSQADVPTQDIPNWVEPVLLLLVRVLGLLLVSLLLYWGRRTVLRLWRRRQNQTDSITTEQTPLQNQTLQDWLAQASAAQAQKDYAAACQALYMALLIQLEEMDWLPQNSALTDQEYLRRLDALWVLSPQAEELPNAWNQLFQTHELLCYGARSASLERFQLCQQAYQLISELPPYQPAVS